MPIRVLVVFGGGPDTARIAQAWSDEWLKNQAIKYELVGVRSGADVMTSIPVCEDHADVLRYDLTLLRSLCDVLIVHTSSSDDGG